MTEFVFNVSLTLMEAVDGSDYEGLSFNTTGTSITVYQSVSGPFIIEYVLCGSNSYSEYQRVSDTLFLYF